MESNSKPKRYTEEWKKWMLEEIKSEDVDSYELAAFMQYVEEHPDDEELIEDLVRNFDPTLDWNDPNLLNKLGVSDAEPEGYSDQDLSSKQTPKK